MSHLNSSLAFEELVEQDEEIELKLLVKSRHELESNAILNPPQLSSRVVMVKGSVTVSF